VRGPFLFLLIVLCYGIRSPHLYSQVRYPHLVKESTPVIHYRRGELSHNAKKVYILYFPFKYAFPYLTSCLFFFQMLDATLTDIAHREIAREEERERLEEMERLRFEAERMTIVRNVGGFGGEKSEIFVKSTESPAKNRDFNTMKHTDADESLPPDDPSEDDSNDELDIDNGDELEAAAAAFVSPVRRRISTADQLTVPTPGLIAPTPSALMSPVITNYHGEGR
jgi:hypothetical protein